MKGLETFKMTLVLGFSEKENTCTLYYTYKERKEDREEEIDFFCKEFIMQLWRLLSPNTYKMSGQAGDPRERIA